MNRTSTATSVASASNTRLVIPFDKIGIEDIPFVGGKNASLGEMYVALQQYGIRVPNGFATTADAWRYHLTSSGLDRQVREQLAGLRVDDVSDLQRRGKLIRDAILNTPLPDDLVAAIAASYRELGREAGQADIPVAVRSSATAEDLPDASFAGQQETFLNVVGEQALADACRGCYASLFTDRAIDYRTRHGFDHFDVALSIGVQVMVSADAGSSGVMFTVDTESGFAGAVLINAAWGLGENIVKGTVNPDEFIVFKGTLVDPYRPIIQKRLGSKQVRMVCRSDAAQATENVPVPVRQQQAWSLEDDDILQLARWAVRIEQHYSQKNSRPTPMDIEFARDGKTGQLFILQARPETVQSRKSAHVLRNYRLTAPDDQPLVVGNAIGQRIAVGNVRVVAGTQDLGSFQTGEVLVAEKTDPDWEPVMKKASAIVTDHGGRTCHAAIVARELDLPAVVGTNDATGVLHDGAAVTVCCAEGEQGRVYAGHLPFEVEETDLQQMPATKTKVMVNIANPGLAFSVAALPVDGVGLARLEFIITDSVKVHPAALLNFDQLEPGLQQEVREVTAGYPDRKDFFVERLAEGVAMIAAAFYPRDVIVRFSDFKSNEYANLIGGHCFEVSEENPMLGFRGASRYYDPKYRDCFGLECQAMKRVRDEMGLQNVKLMIPFCRTVEEGQRVIAEMERHGLVRGQRGLELYVMCEIPSNVLQAREFARIFDGFSIGSNDLTQLTLGIDRDSEIVAHVFDERNPAVLSMIEMAVHKARETGRRIGICGQAPSDFPEYAEFLVRCGIDSISVTPDVVLKTRVRVHEAEQRLAADSQARAARENDHA
jgi:pyruvate,water dikinase